eukprot:gene13186-15197_t
MFAATRFLSKGPARFSALQKSMTTASKPTSSYKEKTFAQNWLSDSGAYPVMGVIVFAVAFCSGAMIYFTATHPDSRVSKVSRKSIFR